jgi:hypothetical protein
VDLGAKLEVRSEKTEVGFGVGTDQSTLHSFTRRIAGPSAEGDLDGSGVARPAATPYRLGSSVRGSYFLNLKSQFPDCPMEAGGFGRFGGAGRKCQYFGLFQR